MPMSDLLAFAVDVATVFTRGGQGVATALALAVVVEATDPAASALAAIPVLLFAIVLLLLVVVAEIGLRALQGWVGEADE